VNRRKFTALAGGVAAWPDGVRAQQPVRVARIGFLGIASAIGKHMARRAGARRCECARAVAVGDRGTCDCAPPGAAVCNCVTLLARSTSAAERTPAVAFKKPVSDVATVRRFGALDSVPSEEVALTRVGADCLPSVTILAMYLARIILHFTR
jgi:hypothetical protein